MVSMSDSMRLQMNERLEKSTQVCQQELRMVIMSYTDE